MLKIVVSSIIILSIFIFATSFFQKYDLPKSIDRGKEVYDDYWMSCHIIDGNGSSDIFPPLNKADYLKNPPAVLINIILQGQSVEITIN